VQRLSPWAHRLDSLLVAGERRPRRALVALGACLILQVTPWWYATPDGSAYVSIARSVFTRDHIGALGNPQLGYPIGYPALISPAFLVSDRPFLLLSLFNVLLWIALLIGLYRWAHSVIPEAAWLLTAVVLANVNVGILYRRTLSEAAFLPLMMWAVVALNEALVSTERYGNGRWILGLLLLLVTTLTREAGLCIAGGLALAFAAHRRQRSRSQVAIAIVVLLTFLAAAPLLVRPERGLAAWRAVSASFAAAPSTGAASLTPLLAGLRERITETGQLIIPGMFKSYSRSERWLDVNLLVYLPVCALVVCGWARLVRRRPDVLACTAPLYLVLHVAWPYGATGRYLLPLLPLMLASLWMATEAVAERRRLLFGILFVAHLGVAVGYDLLIDLPRARACDRQWSAVDALAEHIALDSRVAAAADVPRCVSLMLGLALDRPVAQLERSDVVDDGIRWLITADNSEPATGFAARGRYESYALFERDRSNLQLRGGS